MRNLIGIMTAATLLSGCTAYSPFDPTRTSGSLLEPASTVGSVMLTTTFVAGGYSDPPGLGLMAVVPNLTKSNVDHVRVSVFSVEGGVESPVIDSDGSAMVRKLSVSEAEAGISIAGLAVGKAYRAKALAYKTADATTEGLISREAVAEFTVEPKAKSPATGALSLLLTDVPFSGAATASGVVVTPGDELSHDGPVVIATPIPG